MNPLPSILRAVCWYLLLPVTIANAHTVKQRLSSYEDNQGLTRQRLSLNLGLQFNHASSMSASGYTLDYRQDVVRDEAIAEQEYSRTHYGLGPQTDQSLNVGLSQTWNRLTTTRQMVGGSDDSVVATRSFGAGISHWLFHETLQLGLDVSRTMVQRPAYEYLGADLDTEFMSAEVSTTGISLGLRHLATPTTVLDYTVMHLEADNRPPGNSYAAAVKQFIPATSSAVHLSGARAVNKGRVTRYSNYGEVSAWTGEGAFLQSLWRGATSKVYYRYYREDEVTRVDKTELVRGTDTAGVHLAQEIPKGAIDSVQVPLVVEGGYARYLTNEIDQDGTKILASMFEFGVQAKF